MGEVARAALCRAAVVIMGTCSRYKDTLCPLIRFLVSFLNTGWSDGREPHAWKLHSSQSCPGPFVFCCSVMESPLGVRQLGIGCVLSSGMAAFSCTLHPSGPLPVYASAHSMQLVLFAATSLLPDIWAQISWICTSKGERAQGTLPRCTLTLTPRSL